MVDPADASGFRLGRFALFEYGFRPFFLLAGVWALVMAPLWLYLISHGSAAFGALPTMYWHAHEMLYGFVMAAVAGFMLTAVPSWTGARGFRGTPLVVLVGLWLSGRVAMVFAISSAVSVPSWVIAAATLSFLPALVALLIPPVLRSLNRNMPLLAVLGLLWLIDGAFMWAFIRGDTGLAARALTLAIDCVLILVTVIGGRIAAARSEGG